MDRHTHIHTLIIGLPFFWRSPRCCDRQRTWMNPSRRKMLWSFTISTCKNLFTQKNMKDPLKIYSKSVKDPLIHDFHSPAHPGHPPCRHRCLFRQGHRVRSEPGCSVRVGWSQVKPPWNMGKFHGKIHGNFGLTNPWIDGKNWSMMLQYLFLLPHFKCDITGLCTNLGTRMKNI